MDEIALKKGHGDYVLVISSPEEGCVLDVLPDRCKETLERWFDQFSPEERAQVEVACIDMWDPYRLAIEAKLPNAKIVPDRFHLQKNLNEVVTKARRAIQRQAPEEVRAVLKGSRWLLVRNYADLTEAQQAQLEAMFAVSPELKQCHQLKEDFRQILELTDRDQAAQALSEWQEQVRASGLKQFDSFLTTLANWGHYMLNYFEGRWSNGFAEGLNNKLQLIKRRAFGYHNFENFRLRVLVECEP